LAARIFEDIDPETGGFLRQTPRIILLSVAARETLARESLHCGTKNLTPWSDRFHSGIFPTSHS
jgi:hypothetical protein